MEQDGKRVLVFDVASRPVGLPVQVDGVAWWRDGDSLVPMPEDVRRSIYDETGFDFSGSICVGASLDDLDENAVPNGVTLDNILDRQSPRNRRIAEILSLCGLVERSGQGMNLMYELSILEAKQLPDFKGTDDHFVSITLNGLVLDKKMLSLINKIGNKRLESLATDDLLAIDALFHERNLSDKLRQRLKKLVDLGIVEHISRNRYVLARSLYEVTGKLGIHTRLVGLDRDTNKELILRHIRNNERKGTPFRELEQVLPSH